MTCNTHAMPAIRSSSFPRILASLFQAITAKFSAQNAETGEPTFGGLPTRDLGSRVPPKLYTAKKPMLGAIDTLTEIFYRYSREMNEEDGNDINTALVSLRNRINELELTMGKAEKKCPKCGAPIVIRNNKISGAAFQGCSNFPKCTWSKHL